MTFDLHVQLLPMPTTNHRLRPLPMTFTVTTHTHPVWPLATPAESSAGFSLSLCSLESTAEDSGREGGRLQAPTALGEKMDPHTSASRGGQTPDMVRE